MRRAALSLPSDDPNGEERLAVVRLVPDEEMVLPSGIADSQVLKDLLLLPGLLSEPFVAAPLDELLIVAALGSARGALVLQSRLELVAFLRSLELTAEEGLLDRRINVRSLSKVSLQADWSNDR